MKTRYQFLDVYRGIVVLLMIQGHVVRELLHQSLQSDAFFRAHELFHGITGSGFLFGAGITFGISAQVRWDEYLTFTPALRKRLKRILLLLGIAYALHLPFLSLSKTLTNATTEDWRAFWSFDVLQCIGFGLLILQVAVFIVRKERWFAVSLALLMLVGVYSAPWLWGEGDALPPFLAYALTGNGGSVYPLIPNAAFLFAGALVSYEFLRSVRLGMEVQFVKRLALAGIGLHGAGLILEALPFQVYGNHDYWSTSPNFLLIKLGGIFLLMCGAWYFGRTNFVQRHPRILRWLIILGVESLFVYVVHLILLYGSVLNPDVSVSRMWFQSVNWGGALAAVAGVSMLLIFVAWLWNTFKHSDPILARGLNWWMGTALVVEFITRSY